MDKGRSAVKDRIVVGVSGSPASLTALRRAALTAVDREASLALVCAYKAYSASSLRTEQFEAPEELQWSIGPAQAAEQVLSDAREIAEEITQRRVGTAAVLGTPVRTLLEAARSLDAVLLVVGSRGVTWPGGRTVRQLVRRAPCPVMVTGGAAPTTTIGSVVLSPAR